MLTNIEPLKIRRIKEFNKISNSLDLQINDDKGNNEINQLT